MIFHCARPTRGVRDRALREHQRSISPHPSSPDLACLSLWGQPGRSSNARVERAHSDRARSASRRRPGSPPSLPPSLLVFPSGRVACLVSHCALLSHPPTGTPRRAIKPGEHLLSVRVARAQKIISLHPIPLLRVHPRIPCRNSSPRIKDISPSLSEPLNFPTLSFVF